MIDPAIHQPTKQRRGTDGQSDQTASLLDEYVNPHTASRMFSMRTNQSVEYFYPPCEVIGDNCRPSCVVDCGRSLSWPSPVQSCSWNCPSGDQDGDIFCSPSHTLSHFLQQLISTPILFSVSLTYNPWPGLSCFFARFDPLDQFPVGRRWRIKKEAGVQKGQEVTSKSK